MGAYRLKIDLMGLNPPCSRTVLVPDSFCFRDLAKAIDAAFEWWEGHAYLFEVYDNGERVLEITDYGDEIGTPKWENEDIPVSKYIDKPLRYVYDFGDDWVHRITLESKAEDYDRSYPTLEAFEGRSPPEDCGGTSGYKHLLEVLADLKDPDHKGLGAWAESLGFRDPVPEDICAEMCDISEDEDSRGVWMSGDTELGPYVLPGDSFWDDVDKYRGIDPGPARRIRCDDPFPTYKALNPKQLKWYLSWRAACERGEIVQTDSGYVWLYLAELTDEDDWESAIGKMDALMEAFRGTDAFGLVDSTRWALKKAHEVLGDLRDPSPCFNWQEAARYFSESPLPEPPAAAVECTIKMYENYCEGREDEVAELIGYSLSAMDAYCRSVHGKDVINTLYETKWVTHYGWLPSRKPRTFFENTKGDLALMSISICAVSRMWRMDHPRGGPQVRPALDKEFVNLIDMAVKDCAAGKPFDPDRYGKPVRKRRSHRPKESESMGRYERQMRVFGEEGQEKIASAAVGIIGCGGLGTNVATALASAGVGRFVIIDPDVPEESNLNRQYAYCRSVDIGDIRPKAEILSEWIYEVNPDAEAEFHVGRFDGNTRHLFDGCDLLVDCLDSIAGRMELNRYSVESGKPLVHGAINGYIGQVAACIPGKTPCLYCMMGSVPESRVAPASIGAVVSAIGSLEAAEALKLITGRAGSAGLFLSVDIESWRFQTLRFERDPGCPVCSRLWRHPNP